MVGIWHAYAVVDQSWKEHTALYRQATCLSFASAYRLSKQSQFPLFGLTAQVVSFMLERKASICSKGSFLFLLSLCPHRRGGGRWAVSDWCHRAFVFTSIGRNIKHLIDRPDEEYCFRLHKVCCTCAHSRDIQQDFGVDIFLVVWFFK